LEDLAKVASQIGAEPGQGRRLMGYHGLVWASMGMASNSVENSGLYKLSTGLCPFPDRRVEKASAKAKESLVAWLLGNLFFFCSSLGIVGARNLPDGL
jgi:hypothetical protein